MAKQCPQCRLIVDERFRYCDSCGYDWADPPPSWWESVQFRRRQVTGAAGGFSSFDRCVLCIGGCCLLCVLFWPIFFGLLAIVTFVRNRF